MPQAEEDMPVMTQDVMTMMLKSVFEMGKMHGRKG